MCGHHLCRVVGTAGGPQHREAVGGGLGRRPGDSFARSADVILNEPGLPMVNRCWHSGLYGARGPLLPTCQANMSQPVFMCPGDGRLLQSAAGGAEEIAQRQRSARVFGAGAAAEAPV